MITQTIGRQLTPDQTDAVQSTPSHGRFMHDSLRAGTSPSQSESSSNWMRSFSLRKQLTLRWRFPSPHNLLHCKINRKELIVKKDSILASVLSYRSPLAQVKFWANCIFVALLGSWRLRTDSAHANGIVDDGLHSTGGNLLAVHRPKLHSWLALTGAFGPLADKPAKKERRLCLKNLSVLILVHLYEPGITSVCCTTPVGGRLQLRITQIVRHYVKVAGLSTANIPCLNSYKWI